MNEWREYVPGDLIFVGPNRLQAMPSGRPLESLGPAGTGIVLEYNEANVYDSAYVKALVDGREVYIECKDIKRAR